VSLGSNYAGLRSDQEIDVFKSKLFGKEDTPEITAVLTVVIYILDTIEKTSPTCNSTYPVKLLLGPSITCIVRPDVLRTDAVAPALVRDNARFIASWFKNADAILA